MSTSKHTVSVRLDEESRQRVERAAKILKQSSGAFLEKAGEDRARDVLLQWAVTRYQQGLGSLSELAEETGLAVEEVADAVGSRGMKEAVDMFLASCKTVAETQRKPQFLRLGQEAVKAVLEGATAIAHPGQGNSQDG